jgi:hypothetical protein
MRIDRRGVLAVLVVVVALVGSACGSSNKKSATKTQPASSTVVVG